MDVKKPSAVMRRYGVCRTINTRTTFFYFKKREKAIQFYAKEAHRSSFYVASSDDQGWLEIKSPNLFFADQQEANKSKIKIGKKL